MTSELSSLLPPSEACAQLDTLPPASVSALVQEWGHRFPNSREPEKSQRVMQYLRERVASGALGILRQP